MNSDDSTKFVDGILEHYLPNEQRAGCAYHTQPTIGFVNREGSRRTLHNYQEVIAALQEAGYQVDYQKSFDDSSMADQVKFMSQHDIVIGPHGAQFSTTMFQPKCGSLFEFFLEGYYAPNFFGSIAAISGKHHFFTYNGGEVNRASMQAQREANDFSVRPEVVLETTHRMVERWHQCCQHGFRSNRFAVTS